MKSFGYSFTILFFLCIKIAKAQTFAEIPGPENVLVVYNALSDTSALIMNYYQLGRGIPSSNVLGLDSLFNEDIYDPETQSWHSIVLDQQGETIKDVNTEYSWCATKHAWIYFNKRIAIPIAEHLNTTIVSGDTLKNIIRFIVLCKGIPFRINSRTDDGGWSNNKNVVIDRLLCLVGETIKEPDALLDYFYSNPLNCHSDGYHLLNPYYNADPNFSMDHFFLPDRYKTTVIIGGQARIVSLSYLVTHLSAPMFANITAMIDRSINAINTQDYDWFIDAHPSPLHGGNYLINQAGETENKFLSLGINNYFFDITANNITEHNKPIMTYSSHGVHQYWPQDYIRTRLSFTYADGSIFNTAESFNGYTIGTWPIIRRPIDLHGVVAEYILVGGTVGVAHSYEPTTLNVVSNAIMFPSYALGYSFIESAYLGMISLRGDNVVVGDPLTRISYPCEPWILSSNTAISSGNYDCDIIVPEGITLTINSGSVVNFKRISKLTVYGTLNIESNTELKFSGYSDLIIEPSGTLNLNSETDFIFEDYSKFIVNQSFEITAENNFLFNDRSEFKVNGLNIAANSTLNFNENAKLIVYDWLNLNPGTTMNFYNTSGISLFGSLSSIGESANKVIFNFASTDKIQFRIDEAIGLEIHNTVFNDNGILYVLKDQLEPEYFNITNTTFNDLAGRNALQLIFTDASFQSTPLISNCTFNNCSIGAVFLMQAHEIIIEHNTISLNSGASGITLINNGVVDISDCIITGGNKGICTIGHQEEIEMITTLLTDLNISQCTFEAALNVEQNGIELNGTANPFNSVNINNNHFENCEKGVVINAFTYGDFSFVPVISNNVMSGYMDGGSEIGISLSNGTQAIVTSNSITNFLLGISSIIVDNPIINENTISAIDITVAPHSGILAISGDGEIRANTIQYHSYGIELGSSSPNIGANVITNNDSNGIYIGAYSHPNLRYSYIGEYEYPITGYNTIAENGLCNIFPSISEIYITGATLDMKGGCNTIADDRENPYSCNNLYLINGDHMEETIDARENYWGELNDHNPAGRFGQDIDVNYAGYLNEPCVYSQGEIFWLFSNSKGEVYDTVYSSGTTSSELTDIESRYVVANEYFYNNQYSEAKQEYEEIIQNYGNIRTSLMAYSRLYTIANFMGNISSSFNQLKEFYLQKAGSQSDSVMIGSLIHLSDLCLVSGEEFLSAINNFDEISQQNPNTDIAFYRQIDALTTALLLPQDSSLNKGMLAKYSVNDLSDYTNKLNELIKTRGKGGIESKKELLPIEFSLHQNYPNPFNPTTTIKYDLPYTSEVSLIIYDILGRKIKELVNEKQQAGRYEVQFNASNLASGIYIYQLVADKYMNSKKMILLK